MLGSHLIRAWAKTQSTIALSSAEAELYGGVKTACETLGVAALLKDLGQVVKMRMHMDASAALGIAQRQGVGKVRHLSTGTLWLQEQELKEILKLVKIAGSLNVADIFTKYIGQSLMEQHIGAMNLEYRDGRASAATQLHALSRIKQDVKKVRAEVKKTNQDRGNDDSIDHDKWEPNHGERIWCRHHVATRRDLFDPLNVKSGPRNMAEVGSTRTTIGTFIHGGEFCKSHNWKEAKSVSTKLVAPWIGITVFSDRPLSDETIHAARMMMAAWRKPGTGRR